MNHLDQIRQEAIKTALNWGLDPDIFSIVWDEGPATPGPKYAIPAGIKATGTPQHIAFWSRTIEPSVDGQKPKDIEELNAFIIYYLNRQSKLGYAHLFPTPDPKALAQRYEKIRSASLEEAVEFPPDWLQIRIIPREELQEHIRENCEQITQKREEILQEGANYLLTEMKAGTYSPAEVADLLATVSKFRVDSQSKTQKIGADNEHMPHLLTGALSSRIIGKMRSGINTKGALQESISEIAHLSKERNGNLTGWKTYNQSISEETAEELNQDLAATNWCTGGDIHTAQNQLSKGNFYVYYKNGDPQIAIRTNNNQVAEIRGRGEGQALPTQELKDEAENFLLSKKGPSGGENYLWDQNFRRACIHFNKTGEIQDILLHNFDQNGEWMGAKPKMAAYEQEEFEEGYTKKLTSFILPKEKTERIDPDGSIHLLTSFHSQKKSEQGDPDSFAQLFIYHNKKEINLPYTTVKGDIILPHITKLNAPNLQIAHGDIIAGSLLNFIQHKLQYVGGFLNLENAKKIDVPELKRIERSLEASHAKSINIPKLEYIGRSFHTWLNSTLLAPSLHIVGRTIDINYVKKAYFPNLIYAGAIKANHIQKLEIPKLEHIAVSLRVKTLKILSALKLKSLGGDLDARKATEIFVPELERIDGIANIRNSKKTTAPKLKTINEEFYFPDKRPPRGPYSWQAKLDDNQITLNAAALDPAEVTDKIRHEIAHLVYNDPGVKYALEKLQTALPKSTREEIDKLVKAHYPKKEQKEEAQVRAFEILSRESPKSLWVNFLQSIQSAWNKITGREKIPQEEIKLITAFILEKGIQKLKVSTPKPEPELVLA